MSSPDKLRDYFYGSIAVASGLLAILGGRHHANVLDDIRKLYPEDSIESGALLTGEMAIGGLMILGAILFAIGTVRMVRN